LANTSKTLANSARTTPPAQLSVTSQPIWPANKIKQSTLQISRCYKNRNQTFLNRSVVNKTRFRKMSCASYIIYFARLEIVQLKILFLFGINYECNRIKKSLTRYQKDKTQTSKWTVAKKSRAIYLFLTVSFFISHNSHKNKKSVAEKIRYYPVNTKN